MNAGEYDANTARALWTSEADPVKTEGLNNRLKSRLTKTAIVAKKQALRDAPSASGITTAANITELKAQWDESILGTSPYS